MAEPSSKTTTELVSDTLEDVLLLVRKELELARAGLLEMLAARAKAAGIVALAVVLILPGLMFLLLGAAMWLPFSPQADLMLFGAMLMVLAAGGVWAGVKKMRVKTTGSEALTQAKEDARWLRERVTR